MALLTKQSLYRLSFLWNSAVAGPDRGNVGAGCDHPTHASKLRNSLTGDTPVGVGHKPRKSQAICHFFVDICRLEIIHKMSMPTPPHCKVPGTRRLTQALDCLFPLQLNLIPHATWLCSSQSLAGWRGWDLSVPEGSYSASKVI